MVQTGTMTQPPTLEEYCSSVACAVNHLTEVLHGDSGRDFYDWATLVSQILLGLVTVLLSIITLVLTSKFREEDQRAKEEAAQREKLERRRLVADAIYQVIDFFDKRDPQANMNDLSTKLRQAVDRVADPDEKGIDELISVVADIWDASWTAYMQDRRIPATWTQSNMNSYIRTWVRNPSKFLKSYEDRQEIDRLLREPSSYD